MQVCQLHAEHVSRRVSPQPHRHEPREVRPVANLINILRSLIMTLGS